MINKIINQCWIDTNLSLASILTIDQPSFIFNCEEFSYAMTFQLPCCKSITVSLILIQNYLNEILTFWLNSVDSMKS